MHEDRRLLGIADVFQNRKQLAEVVTVDRPDVIEAEFLEPRAALPDVAGVFFDAGGAALPLLRKHLGQLLGIIAKMQIRAAGCGAREIGRQRSGRRRDRHIVVIQNDDQAFVARACVVHRFVGHAGAHRAITDHCDDIVRATAEVTRHGHAERRRNRCRGMRGAEWIVGTLIALRETRQPARLTQRANAIAPSRQNLMRVRLMSDVPDQTIFRRVENPMQRDRQLDDAKACAQVAARHRDGVDHFRAQFVRQLRKLIFSEPAKLVRCPDAIE